MSTQTTIEDFQQLCALTCTLRRAVFWENRYSFGLHEVRVALDNRGQNSYPDEFSSRSWCGRSTTQRLVRQKTSRLSPFYFPIWMLRLCFSKCKPGIPQDGFLWNFILSIARKSVEKIQVSWKSDMNNECFIWTPAYIYPDISLNSSKNKKCFIQVLYSKLKHIF